MKTEIRIEPLAEALKRLGRLSPVAATLRSDEWEDVPVQLRERSLFSSRIESLRFLNGMRDRLQKSLELATDASGGLVDRSVFIAEMREIAIAEGLTPPDPKDRGGLKDPTSAKRLGLIFDMNTQMSTGHAQWKADMDEDVLDAFPAQELVRVEARKTHRRWRERWKDAGGPTNKSGRLIAKKTDPIWKRISRFGTPWAPFDYDSGMGLRDVSREEAEELGVIEVDEVLTPQDMDFNEGLEAKISGLTEAQAGAVLKLFRAGKVKIEGEVISWAT
jgi:hypothetical protein